METKKFTRRYFLKSAGSSVFWLPILESLPGISSVAFSQTNESRKRFIGMLWPNGDGDLKSGNSTFHFNNNGLLYPLRDLQSNIIIPRGFSAMESRENAYDGNDITHGNGNSYFLTGYSIANETKLLAAPQGTKSIDQYIADRIQQSVGLPIHSLVLGLTNSTTETQLPHNHGFARTISCSDSNRPIPTESSIKALFDRIYGLQNSNQVDDSEKIRKQSIIDHVLKNINSLKTKVSANDSTKLDLYLEQVREVEKFINGDFNTKVCTIPDANGFVGTPNLGDINSCFQYMKKMIDLIVLAHKCDLTRVTTVTMDVTKGQIGAVAGAGVSAYHCHHESGHSPKYFDIIKGHMDAIGYTIRQFKDAGLLEESIIFAGSDCKFGHVNQNNPFIIAGGGSGLKWGQEVGTANSLRPSADLLVDLLKLYGINRDSLGGYVINSKAIAGAKDGVGTGGSGIIT